MTEETKDENAEIEEKQGYDFFATEDYEAFGYITQEGYPVEPSLLKEEDIFFIYQLALMDKESRKELIDSISGLERESEAAPEKSNIVLLH